MSAKYDRLKKLLLELFQLDKPDLDFGIYRIMHARADDISRFLDRDLLPQVRHALASYDQGNRAQVEAELAQLLTTLTNAGVDPETSTKVIELRVQLTDASKADAVEGEVYDLIYRFFSRYYSEGDFISQRRYTSESSYAIPYNGEEVTLHWANKDQYYIKTSEYLRDYAFRLNVHDDANPMRVHFKLVDAAEGEHGNVKAAEGSARVFVLADAGASGHDFLSVDNGELTIGFEYRPAVAADWPVDQRAAQAKPPKQKDLVALTEAALLSCNEVSLAPWVRALATPRLDSTKSVIAAHAERYVARNTFDYFIHKDLGGFLRRELDFFIKNEVMRLDDIEDESAPKVEQYLGKIKAVRRVTGKIIDLLAQLEEFQKKLWLKKKFVVATSYLITVGNIDERFSAEICANDAQRAEWVQLFAIDKIVGDWITAGYSVPLTPDFLKAHPTLTLNTELFDPALVSNLIESRDDGASLDEAISGLLLHGENFQALNLMQARYRGAIDCAYIDPPYNTDSSAIMYKNDYKHSSWLSLIESRLILARSMLAPTGTLCAAIDDEEASQLDLILAQLFPVDLGRAVVRSNPQSRKKKGKLGPAHEYVTFVGASIDSALSSIEATGSRLARYPHEDELGRYSWLNLIRTGSNDLRSDRPKSFYPIYVDQADRVRVPALRWSEDDHEYEILVPPREGEIAVWPLADGPDGPIEKRWHRGYKRVESEPTEYRIRRNKFGKISIDFKTRIDDESAPSTWWDAKTYASSNLGASQVKDLFGKKTFDFPKAVQLVADCLRTLGLDGHSLVLDFFGGSGTTAHATINLNRADAGTRRFALVEVGSHFDRALVPRIRKIVYSPHWKLGQPTRAASIDEAERSPQIIKVLRLESYEDTLNNLDLRRSEAQQSMLDNPVAMRLREDYTLRYMLDVESRGSQSLINVEAFTDPNAYQLKVKSPGSDESRLVNVDLLETFNYLIGLTVVQMTAPRTFEALFERDEEKRLRVNAMQQAGDGAHWFRTVTGTDPNGRRVLVIWRKRPGGEEPEGIEQDNAVLDHWFTNKQQFSVRDSEFDVIYVNGDNNLENLRKSDETWKVRLIEEDFHRLMFDTTGMP